MNILLWLALKTAAPLAVALIVLTFLQRRSAALRHSVIAAGVLAALSVPVLIPIAPAWQLPSWSLGGADAPVALPSGPRTAASGTDEGATAVRVREQSVAGTRSTGSARFWLSTATVLWGSGVALSLLALSVACGRLWRASRESDTVEDDRWHELARECATRYGIATPVRLRESRRDSLLVAFGWRRPTVLLPPGASEWPEERRRIVLAHELAHIQRGDWLTQLAAEAMRAMLWFNPLSWLAAARLRDESERACDDLVLASDIDPVVYAETLASIARSLQPDRSPWVPAPAMARPASLERRVTAMLDPSIDRSRPKRAPRIVLATLLSAFAVALAGYGAAAQSFSTVRGQVQDQHGGTIGGVTVALANATGGQKYEVKSDVTGRYEVVGVVTGDYELIFAMPGFRTVRQPLTVAARTITQNVSLRVGSLEETISVGPGAGAPRPVEKMGAARQSQEPASKAAECVPTAAGGKLLPPTKVKDVRPIYPTGGVPKAETIEFDALIDTDGSVREAKVATPGATPDLVNSAEAAIRQWRFTPTYLNCTPVEVEMRVHVRFQAQ